MAAAGDVLTADEREEAAERRLAELEFVKSAYSPEEAYYVSDAGGADCCVVRLLQLLQCNDGETVQLELRLHMPEAYPVREDATLSIKGSLAYSPSNPPYIRKVALDAIPQLVNACQKTATEIAEAQGGGEAVWSVLACAEEWVSSEWASLLEEHSSSALACKQPKSADNACRATALGRRIIYSHHLIASSKRRDIANLTSQYNLGGYMKIGWPGVVLIEGEDTDCKTFVDEIKRWRWQYLSVRAEKRKVIPEGDDLDTHRKLPMKFEELGKEDMSLLAKNCREAGLKHLFLTCMKISDHRTSEGDEPNEVESNSESPYAVLVHVDHMNDGKRYRRWLRKTCQSQGCSLLVRQFSLGNTAQAHEGRPITYVGIFGEKDSVKQAMKLWRTSHVDVNSKNKPCLERMMTVVEEGAIQRLPKSEGWDAENELDCSLEELECLISAVDADWARSLKSRHCPDS